MDKTLIIGASGKIGYQLVSMMSEAGLAANAMVRDTSKLSKMDHIDIVEANLEADPEDGLNAAFEGCGKVVFCAGSGGDTGVDKTMLVDLWGARKAVALAKKHGIKHFVMVSSIGADDPDAGPDGMQPYLVAKHLADEMLERSGVPYTILRPGKLTDGDGTSKITTQRPQDSDEMSIARADVARVILRVIQADVCKGAILELFNGEKQIEQAIA